MRLSNFILENTQAIIGEWESFAQTLMPAAGTMSKLQLKDHIEQILSFIARDITSPQTAPEQIEKSHGEIDNPAHRKDSAAETHGSLRHADGFNVVQMVSEYRALRASIIKLWTKSKRALTDTDVLDLTRFNESIDQALAESVMRFMDSVDYARNLTLGMLGHDIRSPLAAINLASQRMLQSGLLNDKHSFFATQMVASSSRVMDIVTDLLDITRARLGTGLPVLKKLTDIEIIARQLVDEMRIRYPDRTIYLNTTGEMTGEWDVTRLGQIFSNLIGNALQYADNSPVNVTIQGNTRDIIISIHNEGNPIPSTDISTLFDAFKRGKANGQNDSIDPINLGLGLFITKEIVESHNGSINVTSNKEEGTTFLVRLPKFDQQMRMTEDIENVANTNHPRKKLGKA